MQAYDITSKGRDVQSWSHPDNSSTTSSSIISGRRKLTISDNGTYAGDHKKPNSFGYRRSFTPPGGLKRYNQYGSGGKLGTYRRTASASGTQDQSHSFSLGANMAAINDRALEKLYDKLRGNSNLAVDLAERNATIKMLKNLGGLKRIVKTVTREASKSKRYKRARGPNKAAIQADIVAGKWLEYRYGWLPLMYSTYDLLEEIHRHVFGGLILVKARTSLSVKSESVSGSTNSTSDPRTHTLRTRNTRRELGIYFQIPDNKNVWDFTSLNPIGIAYELMTLSFVIDWFVNIGDTLALWENHVIFSRYFKGGYQTDSSLEERSTRQVWSISRPILYMPNTTPPYVLAHTFSESGSNTGRTRVTEMKRTVLFSLPRPAGFRFKVELNSKRVADAAALLWGFVRRR